MENPFFITGYKSPAYFCDRVQETNQLKRQLRNRVNTTLFSIRRLGKTGLIRHLFETYKNNKSTACIYVDIFSTADLRGFSNRLATAVYNRFPEKKSPGKKIIDFIRGMRPVVSYDSLSGQPEVSFRPGIPEQPEKPIGQILTFLDQQGVKVVFAIDEFQQILEYPEKNTEALLRTCIQGLKNTQFIFAGSNQKMMREIFESARRPFFASCSNMHLEPIKEQEYLPFIQKLFKKGKSSLDPESLSFIYSWTLGHTFYTQYFCNYLFGQQIKHIQVRHVHAAASEILKQHENTFYQYRNLLTSAQWNLLSAIAVETRLYKAHSNEFIHKYKLGTSSMVTRGIDALLEKELIFHNLSAERPYFEVYDKFLMRWLQRQAGG